MAVKPGDRVGIAGYHTAFIVTAVSMNDYMIGHFDETVDVPLVFPLADIKTLRTPPVVPMRAEPGKRYRKFIREHVVYAVGTVDGKILTGAGLNDAGSIYAFDETWGVLPDRDSEGNLTLTRFQ